MPAKVLMVQGTASSVGKSLVVVGLCRLFKNQGYKVAPFKAQNMSNNSFATVDNKEIGRAQAVQAAACGIEPSVYMNPVLLKTTTDRASQVILMGKPTDTLSAAKYERHKSKIFSIVLGALETLRDSNDIVVIEGAGSPAEVNLKLRDIVNMSIAKSVSAPVILVGDIDKGGVFAQFLGTYEILDAEEKKFVKALLINKFRGDIKLLACGLKWIEKRTGKKILGVLPYIHHHSIAEEDAVSIQSSETKRLTQKKQLLVQVIKLPTISNFTDFDPLSKEPDVTLQYIHQPDRHCLPDLLIIPGSKSTLSDLQFIRKSGFEQMIRRCARAGIPILGVCGGYQMLGERILDPQRTESNRRDSNGLGFFPITTVFSRKKTVTQVKAVHIDSQLEVEGYEIHMGQEKVRKGTPPLFKVTERLGKKASGFDGAVLQSGASIGSFPSVMGTYLHGLFDQPKFRRMFLNQIRGTANLEPLNGEASNGHEPIEDPYNRLARTIQKNIDLKMLKKIIGVR